MASLIVCLTSDPGTSGHVRRVIEGEEWDKIYAICSEEAGKCFSCTKDVEFITINPDMLLPELSKEINQRLKDKISDFEVSVNFVSGTGKEHMAMISALLKLGIGLRFVVLTKEGVREL